MQGLTSTLSPQLPRPSHPPVPVTLNASNLELLATSAEKNRVQDFVASQARYAKAQANEGRAVRASWDISTPEKEKMKLHKHQPSAGFETPVLKPRAIQVRAEPDHEPRSPPPPRHKSPVDKPSVHSPRVAKRGKATSGFTEAVPPERQKRPKKSTDNKSRSPKAARKERRARSDTDEEHLARLTERRERKRARREIMNPRKAKASTREDKENEKDAKRRSVEKKKQKIPAGLALMHGFSSTSVGKSRLTMEPPPNFGVFNKGRASAKIKVDGSKRTRHRGHPRIFSEDRLLNSRPANPMTERHSETEHSEASSSSSTGHESSSDKAENLPSVQVQPTPIKIKGTKDRRQPATPRCDSEEVGSDTDSRREAKWTHPAEPTQSRSPAQSACWVIEQDGCSLPSTSSDVSVPSEKSKAETALLDVRTTAWSRILKNPSLGGGTLFPPEYHETPQAVSSLPIPTIVKEVTSKALPEFEEPASIGPWESASQVVRGTLPPQEQKSLYSRFFALPHSDAPGFAQPTTQLANQSLDPLAGVDSTRSDHSANATIDEPLVYGGASMDNRREDPLPRTTMISAPEHTSNARETVTLPNDSVSVLRTPSLDSIERALLDIPEVTCHPSQIRRRSAQRRNFSPNMIFYQYGLDPIDSRCEVPRHFLRDDGYSEPGDAGPLHGNSADARTTQYCAQSLRGEDGTEGSDGNNEDIAGCHEYHAGVILDPHEVANDMVYTQPNASDEWQNEALFFTSEEDIGYDEMTIGTKECCDRLDSASMASANRSALPEGDVNKVTNIHLWGDEAWPREEAVGRSVVHEEVSHMTAVQKVEQDVARKLKGHWFPHKF